ncbi:unnamed protein product [Camellia sinensis]
MHRSAPGVGPFGPDMVRKYTSARFGSYSTGQVLNEEESKLLSASGELCLKYIFAFGAFTRVPLLESASEWKVPTTFIYGYEDWMSYEGAQDARKHMKGAASNAVAPSQASRAAVVPNASSRLTAASVVPVFDFYSGFPRKPSLLRVREFEI